jgi:hypothetical protein
MTNLRASFITFIVVCTWLVSSCGKGSHSMKCVVVNGQTVCFVREVWGMNGDRVVLTTSANVCHQPSAETDFVSDALGAGGLNYYKIDNGKLHVYGTVGRMIKPRKPFPVDVEFEFERFGPFNPSEAELRSNGYSQLSLDEDMTWCLSDLK